MPIPDPTTAAARLVDERIMLHLSHILDRHQIAATELRETILWISAKSETLDEDGWDFCADLADRLSDIAKTLHDPDLADRE